MPTQRELLLEILERWRTQRGVEAEPLLLYALRCIGDPEGDRPVDAAALRRPLDMAGLDALSAQLAHLIEGVGMAEDFVVTGLVRAVDEHLEAAIADRDRDLSIFRALRERFAALRDDPAAAAAFLAARGSSVADLDAALRQIDESVARLEDPGWEAERRAELDAWREQTHDLLCPERRRAWEEERFQAAGEALLQSMGRSGA